MFYIDDESRRRFTGDAESFYDGRALMQHGGAGGATTHAERTRQLHPGPQDRHPRRTGRARRVRGRAAARAVPPDLQDAGGGLSLRIFRPPRTAAERLLLLQPRAIRARAVHPRRHRPRLCGADRVAHRRAQGRQFRRSAARGDRARASRERRGARRDQDAARGFPRRALLPPRPAPRELRRSALVRLANADRRRDGLRRRRAVRRAEAGRARRPQEPARRCSAASGRGRC